MEKIATLKVIRVVEETPEAVSVHFQQPFFWKLKYSAGQYLTLLVEIDGVLERRCFSLNSAPDIEKDISITVKNLKDGKISSFLYNNVKEGDKVKVLHPKGEFTVTPNPSLKRHIVLFGGGSGIAPLMSIMKTILYFEPKSIVSLFYGNRDQESIIYSEELKDIKFDYKDHLNLIHILEDPGENAECYKGRVQREQVPKLMTLVPKLPFGHTFCYISGPTGMMVEAIEGLKLAGVPVSNIFAERYPDHASVSHPSSGGLLIQNRIVKMILGLTETEITVRPNKTILDAALDHGLKMPYVCKDGICGSCKAVCLSGQIHMNEEHTLTDEELHNNIILTCLCKPISNNVVLKTLRV